MTSITPATTATPSAAGPTTHQQLQLNRLVSQYKNDLSGHASNQVLSSLARQIGTAASAAGQHFALPSTGGGAAPTINTTAAVPAATGAREGKLDVMA